MIPKPPNEDATQNSEELVQRLQNELTECRTNSEEYLEGWKRMKADYANARKEADEIRIRLRSRIEGELLREFLEIGDILDEAVKVDSHKGLDKLRSKFKNILQRFGVSEMEVALGDRFDPNLHESLSGEGERVQTIYRSGYMYKDQVLRPAQVAVTHD